MTLGPPGFTPARPYAEFGLGFVIARSDVAHGTTGARLDAIECTLARLVQRWQVSDRLSAARDIRMAPSTIEALFAWIGSDESDARAIERMAIYHSGAIADASVPHGWIRVYVGAERTIPLGQRLRAR